MWKEWNSNPLQRRVGDCAVRAVSKTLNISWEAAYLMLVVNAFSMADMPSSNTVTGALLRQNGFKRAIIPNECPDCYTIEQFCKDNPNGIFMLGTGSHVVSVVDGDYYDTWQSGDEVPVYVWYKDVIPVFDT